MSVSIWIDGELSRTDLDAVEASVAGALGIKPERGDYISVASVPFQSDFGFVSSDEIVAMGYELPWIYFVAIGLLVLILLLVLVRHIRLEKSRSQLDQGVEVAAAVDDAAVEHSLPEQEKVDVLQRLRQYSADRPKDFAQMIRSWLLDD